MLSFHHFLIRDWQTCTLLVEAIGLSKKSMFPPRDWSLSWLEKHCHERFRVKPQPWELVHRWKFDQLVENNVTRILFTNGLKDGWSVGAIQQNLSESLLALNFPNGAHHSDLSGRGPSEDDTDDIQQGFRDIITILGDWLNEVAVGDSSSRGTSGSPAEDTTPRHVRRATSPYAAINL